MNSGTFGSNSISVNSNMLIKENLVNQAECTYTFAVVIDHHLTSNSLPLL